jgi:inner membrane transporter RhtA
MLVLTAALATQVGQACGKLLSGQVGPLGTVTLRLGFAAVVLIAVFRPRSVPRGRRLALALALGVAIAGMNLIYPALRYLPLGIASTLQMLGPLAVALCGSRRRVDAAVVALAAAGLWLVRDPASGPLAWQGIVLALLSAASMGTYLVLAHRLGTDGQGHAVLAVAVPVAAVLGLPAGVLESGALLLDPAVLLAGAGVAVLSAVLPYALEFAALKRLRAGTVGVLLTLEPVVAALAGLVILHEVLSVQRWLGIACISVATAAVTLNGLHTPEPPREPAHEPTAPSRAQRA